MSNSSVHHLPKIKLTPRGKNPLFPSPGGGGGSAGLAMPALSPHRRRGRPSPGGSRGHQGSGPASLAAVPPLSLSAPSPRRQEHAALGLPSPRRGGSAAARRSSSSPPPVPSSPASGGTGAMPPLCLPGPSLGESASRALGAADRHRGTTPDDMSCLLSGFDMHHSRGGEYEDIDRVESDETEIVAAMNGPGRNHSSSSLFWTTSNSHDDVSRLGTVVSSAAASHVPVPTITLTTTTETGMRGSAFGSAPRDGTARMSSPHFLPRPLPPIAQVGFFLFFCPSRIVRALHV